MKRSCMGLLAVVTLVVANTQVVRADIAAEMDTVVVTATRIAQHNYKIAGNITVITQEEIRASKAQSIPEVLKQTLGVNVFDYSSSKTSKLDIRGFGETSVSSILFLVNDRKTNSIDMSGADLLQIPVEAVERIEIIRGAGSVLYGDNAVGGVVNIITKKGEGKLSGRVGNTYGSYDRRSTDAEISGESKGLSYYFYSKYNDDRGYRANSDVLARDFNTRLGYVFSDHVSLDLEAGWHEDDYGQPGSLTEAQLETFGRRGSANESDSAATRDRFVNMSFDVDPWPEDAYFGQLVLDVSFRNRDTYTDNVAWGSDTKNEIDTTGINAKYIFDRTIFGQDVNFVTGIDYYDNDHDITRESGTTTLIAIAKKEIGFYGFCEYELLDGLFINGGTRYHKADYTFNQATTQEEKSPDEWVSMGGAKYEYAEGSNVFMNVQQTFRFLATDEWFNTISGTLNTDLDQQTGLQAEMGIKHNFSDKAIVSVTPYWIWIDDEIYYNPTGGNFGWGANENYDKTRRIGVELGGETDILKFVDIGFLDELRYFANYTYQDPEFSEGTYDGNDIPLVPRHQASTGLMAKFLEAFDISFVGRYVGSRFLGSDTANALSPLKPHFVLDGKLGYTHENVEAYVEVNNIFNEEYSSYASSFLTTKYLYPAPETNFTMGVNVKF